MDNRPPAVPAKSPAGQGGAAYILNHLKYKDIIFYLVGAEGWLSGAGEASEAAF
jgi:hypothetical protein